MPAVGCNVAELTLKLRKFSGCHQTDRENLATVVKEILLWSE
jgi:hypothetical protein